MKGIQLRTFTSQWLSSHLWYETAAEKMSVLEGEGYLWNLKMIGPTLEELPLLAMVAKVKELKSTAWVMSLGFVLSFRWEENRLKRSPPTKKKHFG